MRYTPLRRPEKRSTLFVFALRRKNKMRIATFFKKILHLMSTIVESAGIGTVSDEENGFKKEGLIIRVRPRWRLLRCGKCGRPAKARHGKKGKIRYWRHLSALGFPVWLKCRVHRVVCTRCGVHTMAVPWARVGSTFTRVFEDEVAWFMQKTNQTATAEYFGISWPTAGKIARRVVAEKCDDSLLEDLQLIGVDEISYGRPRKFLTVVVDHKRHKVVWGAEGQSAETLGSFFEMLGPERRAKIEVVSMDMSAAFENAVGEHVPQAEIIYDRFHVVALASKAVDDVRREQVRNAPVAKKKELKSTRWALLKNPWNLTPSEKHKLATVQNTNARIYRAYLLKETLQTLFDAATVSRAEDIFVQWFGWARRSKLEPFRRLALTLKTHLSGILRFIEKRITNSPVEGYNSKIRMISHRAFGFHSAAALIAMIKLNCSGIQLDPVGHHV